MEINRRLPILTVGISSRWIKPYRELLPMLRISAASGMLTRRRLPESELVGAGSLSSLLAEGCC
jgi:hypothetical protein